MAKSGKNKRDVEVYDYEDGGLKNNPKAIIIGVWLLIIAGLLAAFIVTTNQNSSDENKGAIDISAKAKPLEDRLEKNPKDLEALLELGYLYYDAKRYGEAAVTLEKAVEMNGRNVDALIGLGLSYQGQNLVNESLSMYNKALEVDPNNDLAKIRKGYILSEAGGDKTEALKLLREAEAKQAVGNLKSELQQAISKLEKEATSK